MGQQQKINLESNKKLKKVYLDAGITRCEGCGTDSWLSWHHRHGRRFYRGIPLDEGLASYNQTLLLCVPKCHNFCEVGKGKGKDRITAKDYSDNLFNKLRGSDLLE